LLAPLVLREKIGGKWASATIGTAPMAILVWTFISMQDLVLLRIAWALDTFGALLKREDYRFGEVSALPPFPYPPILFALGANSRIAAKPPTGRT
tara:strand:+ start:224 stop:508 length:285 start_codon:yes stop_codon:yes gene_type:complete